MSDTLYFTGVGSRETPVFVLLLIELVGELYCALGYTGRSGFALGADRGFYVGAQRCLRFEEVGFDNYLPNDWFFNKAEFGFIKPDPARRIYDARRFTETYDEAMQMALEARGSWNGLGPAGIQLHTRNTMQVFGHTLKLPSAQLSCWARPVGKRGQVSGGTNTAVQLALRHNISVRNLYLPEVVERVFAGLNAKRDLLCAESVRTLEALELLWKQTPGLFNTFMPTQPEQVAHLPDVLTTRIRLGGYLELYKEAA